MAAINFKGGTGKTTVAIAIAEGLCHLLGKRVVVIDCVFQCSASIALLGRRTLNDLIVKNATVDCLLHSNLAGRNGRHLGAAAVKTHFCVAEASDCMYLLPGNPDMPRRERQILASFLPKTDIHSAYESAATKMGEVIRSLLDALGGRYDVCIDASLLPSPPVPGGVLDGTFWLSGRFGRGEGRP